jgi:hypothetical protein
VRPASVLQDDGVGAPWFWNTKLVKVLLVNAVNAIPELKWPVTFWSRVGPLMMPASVTRGPPTRNAIANAACPIRAIACRICASPLPGTVAHIRAHARRGIDPEGGYIGPGSCHHRQAGHGSQ